MEGLVRLCSTAGIRSMNPSSCLSWLSLDDTQMANRSWSAKKDTSVIQSKEAPLLIPSVLLAFTAISEANPPLSTLFSVQSGPINPQNPTLGIPKTVFNVRLATTASLPPRRLKSVLMDSTVLVALHTMLIFLVQKALIPSLLEPLHSMIVRTNSVPKGKLVSEALS